MITKDTIEYKEAQNLANRLLEVGSMERWNSNTLFNLYYDPMGRFLQAVMELDCFAAQVAGTVEGSMNPYGHCVARMSSKQAWVIACAAIENKLTLIID